MPLGCLLLMESMLSSSSQYKWTGLWRYSCDDDDNDDVVMIVDNGGV